MPAGKGNDSGGSTNNPGQRTTFRPPWVKEGTGPNPLPMPTAPWTFKSPANRRDSNTSDAASENPLANVQLRKTSIQTKEPQENGNKESVFVKPALKPVPPKENTVSKKDHKLPIPKLNSVAERQLKESPPRRTSATLLAEDDEIDRATPTARNALVRAESLRRISQTPAPPPMPPPPPPLPNLPADFKKKQLNEDQVAKLEMLRARPKTRPDWTAMLKEIEGNKKLKHVECNDRSEPLLPKAKAKENFVYESEQPNVHNELLKQIQGGIHLKKVKTNDRSKPMLEGLRKFRRQMTIEEQIQKSISMASISPEEIADEVDEMDDIDKVRDDLQSTKQMLALEMRNKEAQERENKRLLARIQNLEAELEKERSNGRQTNGVGGNEADEKLINSLKKETEEARKTSQELERKYTEAAEQLDANKMKLDEVMRQNQMLEKRLQDALQGKRLSFSDRKESVVANGGGEDTDDEIEEEESSDESDDDSNEEKREKRLQRELKQLRNKLRNFKNKEDNAKKERIALRDIIKKHQLAMKEEKKKYKHLKKEVDKMAALMKECSDDEEDDDEAEDDTIEEVDEEEETEEEESSDDESESEEEESDSERSQSEPEDAPAEKVKQNLSVRAKRHENILNALKKGNFMLKTNAERLQDDLNKQKEMTESLQQDLNSVLSEFG